MTSSGRTRTTPPRRRHAPRRRRAQWRCLRGGGAWAGGGRGGQALAAAVLRLHGVLGLRAALVRVLARRRRRQRCSLGRRHLLPKMRCPACAAPLTTADAEEAPRRCPAVAGRRYDRLARDATLRAMPDWRGCPSCDGGGFTSAKCLQPLREELSAAVGEGAGLRERAVAAGAGCAVRLGLGGRAARRRRVRVQSVIAGGTARAVASTASAPLAAACPECEASFLVAGWSREGLAAHAAGGGSSGSLKQAGAEKTARWVETHTRHCPSCSSPIQKAGGCNHMRCGGCNKEFCWACMRTRTQCGHFGCHNGAPFGDAPPRGEDGLRRGAVDDAVDAELSARYAYAERRAGVLVRCAALAGGLAAAVVVGALSVWRTARSRQCPAAGQRCSRHPAGFGTAAGWASAPSASPCLVCARGPWCGAVGSCGLRCRVRCGRSR